jgi:hypothetical protein
MGDVPVPGYQTFRTNKRSTPKPEHQTLLQQYPEADAQLKQLLKLLGDVEDVARRIQDSVRESAEWAAIVNSAEEHGASTTLQCMRLTDLETLNFNNNISTAAVFLDIEKVLDTTWHSGLVYAVSKLEFSTNWIKLISSFLSQRKFSVSVEGEMSTAREMRAGVPQGSVLSPTLYNMYINDVPKHLVCI